MTSPSWYCAGYADKRQPRPRQRRVNADRDGALGSTLVRTRGLRGGLAYAASRPGSSVPSAQPRSSRLPRCTKILCRPMALLLALLLGCLGVNTSLEGFG